MLYRDSFTECLSIAVSLQVVISPKPSNSRKRASVTALQTPEYSNFLAISRHMIIFLVICFLFANKVIDVRGFLIENQIGKLPHPILIDTLIGHKDHINLARAMLWARRNGT